MEGRTIDAVKKQMNDALDFCELQLMLIAVERQEREKARARAVEHARSTAAEAQRLKQEEERFIRQSEGPLSEDLLRSSISVEYRGRTPLMRELSRRRKKLQEDGNPEYADLQRRIEDARLRAESAREDQRAADFDVEHDCAVVRHLITMICSDAKGALDEIAASYARDNPQESREVRRLASEIKDSVSVSGYRLTKKFQSKGRLIASEIREVRAEAEEELRVIRKVLSEDSGEVAAAS